VKLASIYYAVLINVVSYILYKTLYQVENYGRQAIRQAMRVFVGDDKWKKFKCSPNVQSDSISVNNNNNIPNNKPDVIIRDNEKGTCMLIDIAFSGDRNVIKKEAEKILKYKDLTIGIQRMWIVRTKVIPVITGATGTISKSFRKYVSNIPGKHEVKKLQKIAIFGTAHIRLKVLM